MVGNHHGKRVPGPENPRRSAERRPGLRHWPVILRRSGDGSYREADHRVRRIRTSASRRFAPLTWESEKKTNGVPGPHLNRANRVGCLTRESGPVARA